MCVILVNKTNNLALVDSKMIFAAVPGKGVSCDWN